METFAPKKRSQYRRFLTLEFEDGRWEAFETESDVMCAFDSWTETAEDMFRFTPETSDDGGMSVAEQTVARIEKRHVTRMLEAV